MGQASILQKSQNMKSQNKDGILNEDGLADLTKAIKRH